MKKLIVLISITTLLVCCSKSDVKNEIKQFYNLDSSIEFAIFDNQNEDLLNPENPNHLNTANFKIFYVINGEKQEVYDPNMDYPRNFKIYKHENEYRIRVFLNISDNTTKPITYIQWNKSDTDTIEVSYQKTQYGILQNIIWFNGKQIWERGNNTIDPYFMLTK